MSEPWLIALKIQPHSIEGHPGFFIHPGIMREYMEDEFVYTKGELTVTYADASAEVIKGGDLFYWPPGHTVKVAQDAEVILFSPQHEHDKVIDHMKAAMGL